MIVLFSAIPIQSSKILNELTGEKRILSVELLYVVVATGNLSFFI
jgi:hypothetical protein